MNAAKVTLTSTILAAALGLAFGLMNTPAQAHTTACETKPDHKHCGGGGTTFTVQLFDQSGVSTGAFDFCPWGDLCGAIEVTPNTRENELRSDTDLDMVRPDPESHPDEFDTWNDVFNACKELLGLNSVVKFFVASDDWSIHKAGGVRVVFRDIELQDIDLQGTEVRVQLIGDEFDFDDPFLPAPGETSIFELTRFSLTGTPVRGRGAIKSCRGSAGGGELGFIDGSGTFIPSPSTLVITASVPG